MVINSKLFGPFLHSYRSKKGIPIGLKLYSLAIMWAMIAITCIFIIKPGFFTVLLIVLGLVGSWVKVFVIPTVNGENSEKSEEGKASENLNG